MSAATRRRSKRCGRSSRLTPTRSWSAAALGAGTTCKLVNNSITIGMFAVIAEGFATAAKLGVDLEALSTVLSAGGADGRMWQMMKPWILEGDDSQLNGPIRIGAKDIRTYGGWPRMPAWRPSSPRPSTRPPPGPEPGPCRALPAGAAGHSRGAQRGQDKGHLRRTRSRSPSVSSPRKRGPDKRRRVRMSRDSGYWVRFRVGMPVVPQDSLATLLKTLD